VVSCLRLMASLRRCTIPRLDLGLTGVEPTVQKVAHCPRRSGDNHDTNPILWFFIKGVARPRGNTGGGQSVLGKETARVKRALKIGVTDGYADCE
jgi:hypothetical protein